MEIETLLAQPEGQDLAFARAASKPEELAETLVALANGHGGRLIIGVGRGRKLEGVPNAMLAQTLLLDAGLLCTPPLLLPPPEVAQSGGATLVCAMVPPGMPHVYSVRGRYLWRAGAEDAPVPPDALRRLLLERGETQWEKQRPPDAAMTDLDQHLLQAYLTRIGPPAEGDPATFLLRRGVAIAPQPSASPLPLAALAPTNAGLLLFGRTVDRFFPQCEITLVRYRGAAMSDEFLREDLRVSLPESVRRAEIWLSEHMRRGSRMIGLERQDWAQFPLGAVREALVNAVAHRDYRILGEGIRIALFSDRLECYSPGRLSGHVTLHNMVEERFSRNPSLVQVLADVGLIERLGYGIDRMLRQMEDAGLPPPEFRETAAGFLVTLRGQQGETEATAVSVDTRAWRKLGLNERQIAAMVYIAKNGRISNRELQELAADVSPETLRRDLADLVERNLLLRIGDKRGAYYIVK